MCVSGTKLGSPMLSLSYVTFQVHNTVFKIIILKNITNDKDN